MAYSIGPLETRIQRHICHGEADWRVFDLLTGVAFAAHAAGVIRFDGNHFERSGSRAFSQGRERQEA
jgi:hypothetical protein